jgi:hypothetical protein
VKWSQLEFLLLSNRFPEVDENNIGSGGVKYLAKAEMPLLETIWLGDYGIS